MPDEPIERAFPAYAPRVTSEFRASLLQIPIFGSEQLRITGVNINPTVATTLVATGRLWSDARKDVQYFREDISLPAAGAQVDRVIVLERGSLLTLRLSVSDNGIQLGDVWALAGLIEGSSGAITGVAILLQGYTAPLEILAWPGSVIQSRLGGPGAIRTIAWTVASAVAVTATVPANRRWRINTSRFLVATSAIAGGRSVQFTVTRSGGSLVFISESQPVQPAATAFFYSLVPNAVPVGSAALNVNYLPFLSDLELNGGDTIAVTINAALAGDTLTPSSLLVREWFNLGV